MKKLTTEEFIEKGKAIHEDKYDYSLVEYINSTTKVKIICSEHGVFEQTPNSHLHSNGCLKCGIEVGSNKQRMTNEGFIEKAKVVHGDKYGYSLVVYVNNSTKVKITCPEHGVFEQRPRDHLRGCGCPNCAGNILLTTEKFIEKAREIHGDKYDYSLVEYINNRTKVKIICPEHGVFEQTPKGQLKGRVAKYVQPPNGNNIYGLF